VVLKKKLCVDDFQTEVEKVYCGSIVGIDTEVVNYTNQEYIFNINTSDEY